MPSKSPTTNLFILFAPNASIESPLARRLDSSYLFDASSQGRRVQLRRTSQVKKADFVSLVRESLQSVLGDAGTKATIFHLGGESALQDPTKFVDNLKSVFDAGAETILQEILKNLESSESHQQN